MAAVADRVKETSTTTGTGTINLGGAATGFRAFSATFASGTVVYYCITDGTDWEVGSGPVTTGTPWTLARTTVLASSNAGALVNWAAGSRDVFCTAPAAAITTATTKLPTITAVPSGNALTIGMSSIYLDFRSATAGDGTVSTVLCAPANTVISSGSTGGTVSGIQSDLYVICMNNAGTAELAWCNASGGVNLDEMGFITTTAEGGAGGADSASVVYSTTARSNLPFHVVGIVRSTQVAAGTWVTDPSVIQGTGGNVVPGLTKMALATAQATTSGTSIDFTGIPNWVKKITVMLNGVSTNGTSNSLLQIGSGSVDTTGYATGTEGYFQASNSCTATVFPSNGFLIHQDRAAATTSYGVLTLVNMGSNIWCIFGMHSNGAAQITNLVGVKTALSGILDRIRLTTANGTDAFDAGSVNIMYEG